MGTVLRDGRGRVQNAIAEATYSGLNAKGHKRAIRDPSLPCGPDPIPTPGLTQFHFPLALDLESLRRCRGSSSKRR